MMQSYVDLRGALEISRLYAIFVTCWHLQLGRNRAGHSLSQVSFEIVDTEQMACNIQKTSPRYK